MAYAECGGIFIPISKIPIKILGECVGLMNQFIEGADIFNVPRSDGVEARDDGVWISVAGRDHLAVDVGWDATHLIVDGWDDWDGLSDGIDVGKLEGDLSDGRQLLEDLFCTKVIKF